MTEDVLNDSKRGFINLLGVLGVIASLVFFVAPGAFNGLFSTDFAGTSLLLVQVTALFSLMLSVLVLRSNGVVTEENVRQVTVASLVLGVFLLVYNLANGEWAPVAALIPLGAFLLLIFVYVGKVNLFGGE